MEEDFKKVNLIELLRTFKKEGLDNFVVIRKENFKKFIPISVIQNKYKEYEWAIKSYDSSNADYKQHQAVGSWNVLRQLLEERK